MIKRTIIPELLQASAEYPVVTILGPRQAGKTTLARMCFPGKAYYSLEDPDVQMAAAADPRAFLTQMPDGGILDEVQRLPLLLSYIQGIVDSKKQKGQFILTGSHQPELHQAVSQSLAGRTALLTLLPFSLGELRQYKADWDPYELIVCGAYPRLHEESLEPRRFYNAYLQTYVERDVRSLLQLRDLAHFQKFMMLLAGRVGQLLNYSSLSNDIGVSATTIRNWLSVLNATYITFELQPYFENISKRVVKSPKIYFTDPGLAAFLLGIHEKSQAMRDPSRGGLYENLIITEIAKGAYNRGIRPELYFYRDAHGVEVDLIIREKGKLIPIEIKSAETYSNEFLKGLEKFNALCPDRVINPTVLYNGTQRFNVRGAGIWNPFDVDDLWGALVTESSEG